MFFAGYFLVRSLLPVFPVISERISGLIWFGSVYLVTTAGFVADQLMCAEHEQQQQLAISGRVIPEIHNRPPTAYL